MASEASLEHLLLDVMTSEASLELELVASAASLEHSFLGLARCRSPRCYGERSKLRAFAPRCYGERSELRAYAPRCDHRFPSPQSAARQGRIPHSPAQIRKSLVSQAPA